MFIGDLLTTPSFYLKILDLACCCCGVAKLYENGFSLDILDTIIIHTALCGGAIAALVMLFSYIVDDRSNSVEVMLLAIYGALSLASSRVFYLHINFCKAISETMEHLFMICALVAFSMLCDLIGKALTDSCCTICDPMEMCAKLCVQPVAANEKDKDNAITDETGDADLAIEDDNVTMLTEEPIDESGAGDETADDAGETTNEAEEAEQ